MAIVGAIGDSQAESNGFDWGLTGLNREILNEAREANKVSVHKGLRVWGRTIRPIHKALEYSIDPEIPGVSGSSTGAVSFLQEIGISPQKEDGSWRTLSDLSVEEQKKLASAIIIERASKGHQNPEWIFGDVYELLDRPQEFRDASEFATMINACGKLGKTYLGIQLCFGNPEAGQKIKALLEDYRKTLGTALRWVESNKKNTMKETENGVYIFAGDNISEHILSNIISIIHKNNRTGNKPLFGFAVSEEGLKISGRATDEAVGLGINLKEILSVVSVELGGEGGGHAAASGATIPAGTEELFVQKVDSLLQAALNKNINTKVDKWSKEAEEKLVNQISYAKAGFEETGAKAEGKGGQAGWQGSKGNSQAIANEDRIFKKVERKGLVQYFSS